jgi:hypothetical protein
MTFDRRVIQDIRLRRAQAECAAALKVSEAVAAQMVQLSGVQERGIDPARLRVTPAEVHRLLELARTIEAEEAMLEPHEAARHTPRRAV